MTASSRDKKSSGIVVDGEGDPACGSRRAAAVFGLAASFEQ